MCAVKAMGGKGRAHTERHRTNAQGRALDPAGAVARRLSARLDQWRRDSGAIMPAKNPNADPAWPGWNLTGEEEPTPPVS